jgi:hypothetical protein
MSGMYHIRGWTSFVILHSAVTKVIDGAWDVAFLVQ